MQAVAVNVISPGSQSCVLLADISGVAAGVTVTVDVADVAQAPVPQVAV